MSQPVIHDQDEDNVKAPGNKSRCDINFEQRKKQKKKPYDSQIDLSSTRAYRCVRRLMLFEAKSLYHKSEFNVADDDRTCRIACMAIHSSALNSRDFLFCRTTVAATEVTVVVNIKRNGAFFQYRPTNASSHHRMCEYRRRNDVKENNRKSVHRTLHFSLTKFRIDCFRRNFRARRCATTDVRDTAKVIHQQMRCLTTSTSKQFIIIMAENKKELQKKMNFVFFFDRALCERVLSPIILNTIDNGAHTTSRTAQCRLGG